MKNENVWMKNVQLRSRIFILLALFWMIVIFYYSSKTAVESTQDSMAVGMAIGRLFVADYDELPESEQYDIAKCIEHPIRKTAHAMEYAVLGLLLTLGLYANKKYALKRYFMCRNILCPWMFATFYACTDEFHQLFVPGRSGQITDVCIDSGGALFGVLCGVMLMIAIKPGE